MEPKISIGCVANLFSRQMHFQKAGDIEQGHSHPFDHLSLLAHGTVLCTVNNKTTEFKAPAMIYIAKDRIHEFVALEDDTVVYCIHALRIGERVEDIVDPGMMPAGIAAALMCDPLTN